MRLRESARWALALATMTLASTKTSHGDDTWDAVARVVAVGDVHGDYDQFLTVLRDSGLVDDKARWTGGKAWLVQTGDRVDRGPDSRKVMDLLQRLEKEAKKAGGAVQALLGNHEAMNMIGDLRYVSPEEFAAFKSPDSERRREALWQALLAERKKTGEPPLGDDDRKRFDAERPLGWVEHRLAYAPNGQYGDWLKRENAVVKIGDTLFLHGGLSPKYADFSLRDLNEKIRAELAEPDAMTALLCRDPDGPLWFRGLAQGDPSLLPHLEAVLAKHQCRRMVVGHTVTEGNLVFPRYAGRVVQIDVGLSKVYGGPPAALVLEDGKPFAIHRGKRLALPESDGEPLVRYVREVAALEPSPERLKPLLAQLESALTAPPAPPP
jgi:Calcineurin-like phosphoesterase